MGTTKNKGQPKLRAVLYLRQSTAREESISMELQETAGRDYAKRQGYNVVAVEQDPGISGRTWDRPGVQRAMSMIETKQADVIVLWKWSRLSRARLDWAVAIDKVESAGGRIESATEPVDVDTSTGRLARGMLAEFAAFESERIGDTWKEAHRRRVAQGLTPTGTDHFGYDYDSAEGYTPNPEEASVLQECYRLYLAGQSFRNIVKYLNTTGLQPKSRGGGSGRGWCATVVIRLMDSPFAAGYIRYRGENHPGRHEPLLTSEQWEAYTVRRAQRKGTREPANQEAIYRGLLFCGTCGHRMHLHARVGGKLNYSCAGSGVYRLHRGGYVLEHLVTEEVLKWLRGVHEAVNRAAAEHPVEPVVRVSNEPALRRGLMKAQARLDRLTGQYVDEVIPKESYERLRDKLTAEIGELEQQLAEQRVEAALPPPLPIPALLEQWEIFTPVEKLEILGRLIDRIVVTGKRPRSQVEIVPKWAGGAGPEVNGV